MTDIIPTSNPKDRIGITKLPCHLIPPAAMVPTTLALMDGMLKYGKFNWRKESVAATIYIDAAKRHIDKWAWGQENDAVSSVHELGHAMACLIILIDAQQAGNLVDDRTKDERVCKLIDDAAEQVKALLKQHGKDVPSTSTVLELSITDEEKRKLLGLD